MQCWSNLAINVFLKIFLDVFQRKRSAKNNEDKQQMNAVINIRFECSQYSKGDNKQQKKLKK